MRTSWAVSPLLSFADSLSPKQSSSGHFNRAQPALSCRIFGLYILVYYGRHPPDWLYTTQPSCQCYA